MKNNSYIVIHAWFLIEFKLRVMRDYVKLLILQSLIMMMALGPQQWRKYIDEMLY